MAMQVMAGFGPAADAAERAAMADPMGAALHCLLSSHRIYAVNYSCERALPYILLKCRAALGQRIRPGR